MKLSLLLFFTCFLYLQILFSQDVKKQVEVGIIEHLDEFVPSDIQLMNEDGKMVNLKDQIDKPTALIFVYFRCPGICTPLMDGVADVIQKLDMKLAEDYQVITIGFDPREKIDLAIKKKKNYQSLITNQNTDDGWRFFTSDSANIARVTEALGFKYIKAGTDFTHAATVIVLSPNGKITRYLNGTYFLPFEFKLALIEASKGHSGPTMNKILQFCYSYDPVGKAYVLNVTRLSGTLILSLGLIVFLVLIIRKPRKRNYPKN
ncbi:SCO family protein [Ancylomarina salipaludis]|uniref:SCO family protein n=1 Tax=Ancylomarina salipaludis TaxID=2501299 RepID=A0A4Q1JNZ8_9BACT|nr:SCO family protein [Ancylomarina salipaludis]RXQ96599.1 SCO family protein [Ancylomarina salipaludis]